MTSVSRRNFLMASTLAAPFAAPLSAFSRDEDVREIAEEAYIWGLPLVLQEKYLQLARDGGYPLNRFTLSTRLSTPDDKVAGPNVDTLYGFAWLDLEREPLVLLIICFIAGSKEFLKPLSVSDSVDGDWLWLM